ncbi:MAG: polymer-forming cytoskeletal protein [Thioalkalispiraceae bacterium]|jgi:cytoskeletal protein CcmA (bactofilin family)
MQAVSVEKKDKKQGLRRTLDNIIRFTSSVGEGTIFTGSFSGGENIVVRGQVQGQSDVQGAVVIADTGKWLGELIADVVIVAGSVEGDIRAREKIEVQTGANIKGNLYSPVIAIEAGAVHAGRIDMKNLKQIKHFEEKRDSEHSHTHE